ncbi:MULTISPECIES: carbamoyltransferase C-terminal domain-containing protein [Nocardiopsis]|uniref:carbamoyltransferase family protein n=1 Tax=Nocardiopsis TaxID=2013 RepID=UPI0020165DA5|nr:MULTISPECIES: carbamoyltransferase C-terminal domain-containing protein [Nocardiopsis]WDZ92813.1 carbamoyltransferase C-terminal domain-containing protein [Nocardiopsis sp. HUAS JQ3]
MTTPVLLGLCSGTHDSAAALISDGKLVGLVEEERLNGDKHTRAFPRHAIDYLLTRANLTADDVTSIAYNFDPGLYRNAIPSSLRYLLHKTARRRALPRATSFARVHRRASERLSALTDTFPRARVTGVEHHRAHGIYAFAASGYDSAAVLIVDSLGETTTTSIARVSLDGDRAIYEPVARISDPASLGYAYGAVTQHLGWRRGDEEGTVMALAALGDPSRFRALFRRAIRLTENGFSLDSALFPLRVISSRYPRLSPVFTAATCPPRTEGSPLLDVHADLAAALQERTEQTMVHLARRARELTGEQLLCVGGGVAMNCVSIGAIVRECGFEEVAVPPAPGDAGTAAGAALSLYAETTGTLASGTARRCYLGPDYPEITLDSRPREGLSARRITDPVQHLARQLADGRIVGLFQGRLEAGPRALGNRSILASPLHPEVVNRLNATVKFREPFRPFAPVVLEDKAADYFTLGQPSPFMSIASGVTPLAKTTIPAVVHANGTARVQTLTRKHNPFLAEVLTAFAELTGVPVLINTSLNIKGKPICGTPEMALDCLQTSGLDALLLEQWWVEKT